MLASDKASAGKNLSSTDNTHFNTVLKTIVSTIFLIHWNYSIVMTEQKIYLE